MHERSRAAQICLKFQATAADSQLLEVDASSGFKAQLHPAWGQHAQKNITVEDAVHVQCHAT